MEHLIMMFPPSSLYYNELLRLMPKYSSKQLLSKTIYVSP